MVSLRVIGSSVGEFLDRRPDREGSDKAQCFFQLGESTWVFQAFMIRKLDVRSHVAPFLMVTIIVLPLRLNSGRA